MPRFMVEPGKHGINREWKEASEKAHCQTIEKHLTEFDFIREHQEVGWADRE